MPAFRDNFVNFGGSILGNIPFGLLTKYSDTDFILPFYHSVSDNPPSHLRHLYRVRTVSEFCSDLDFLLKHYTPVDLTGFFDAVKNRNKSAKPFFLLSFDDGLKEFYTEIAPVLLKKGIPAVNFINSSFVDNQDLFFRYKASILIDFFIKNPELLRSSEWENWSGKTSKDVRQLRKRLLSITYEDSYRLDELAKVVGISFTEYLKEKEPYMTSAQIKELTGKGFEFGGHSIDHPFYGDISREEQIRQTIESVNFVHDSFGSHFKVFAFPFSDYGVSKQVVLNLLAEYELDAVFGSGGVGRNKSYLHFQRIPLERKNFSARSIISAEVFYGSIKSFFKPLYTFYKFL